MAATDVANVSSGNLATGAGGGGKKKKKGKATEKIITGITSFKACLRWFCFVSNRDNLAGRWSESPQCGRAWHYAAGFEPQALATTELDEIPLMTRD